jgi:hypothetical protein
VTATIALVLAASGGAYAATQLPKNSVGSRELAPNAVSSSKVKNGSLVSKDFRAGQLPAGERGSQGLQGLQGPKGDNGDRGPSDAFNETSPFGQLTNLPAGSYQINGKAEFSGATGLAAFDCTLTAAPTAGGAATTLDHSRATATTSTGTTDFALPLQATVTFAQAQNLSMNCVGGGAGGSFSINNVRLSAVQVAAIH